MLFSLLFLAALTVATPSPRYGSPYPHGGSHCPPIKGDFNVTYFRLYPEGFDYDSIHCKAYIGGNFNSTVLKKDLHTGEQELLTFPGISFNETYHISGIEFSPRTGAIYFSANNGIAFQSGATDLTGPNKLIKYDTFTNRVVWISDMAPVIAEIKRLTGIQVNGFQDVAEDLAGNVYSVITFGRAIVKITPDGKPSIYYYTPHPPSVNGVMLTSWNGIMSVGDLLILPENSLGKFYVFNTKNGKATPKIYTPKEMPSGYSLSCDRINPPAMFDGTVALCSDDAHGVAVYHSTDKWNTAEYLGLIPNRGTGIPTASGQISNGLYYSNEFFFDVDPNVFDLQPGGNRTIFPFYDITSEVRGLVSRSGRSSW
ncbi:hypothetical protein F5884DRAFT_513897 [Xylogone sp. PMI_703]|nr:hypothetical protein F5884DRAFT_513897 [Xylogone sp. PMI_703]